MLPRICKTSLFLFLALCLGASLASTPALAAGGQKQQCQNAIKDCVNKARSMTCNRRGVVFRLDGHICYPADSGRRLNSYANKPLCGSAKWWVPAAEALAHGCPSDKQAVSAGAVEAAIRKARQDMLRNCFKTHVYLNPNESPSHCINQYPYRKQHEDNCTAFVDAFAKCLREKYKRNPFK